MPDHPLAYFITWTVRGTWLHFDERGSVDRAHNVYGTPILPPDAQRELAVADRASRPTELLTEDERLVIEGAIRDQCTHAGWGLLAVNVRTNHVHVVVVADYAPERAMQLFKSWSTRRLRERGHRTDHALWTRHGSTRYLWTDNAVEGAIRYVREMQ
ncbi:MAG: transposase [Phycisphaerales bacterium]|nr:transposase [Phycisphaerales bacterium]